MKKVYLVIAALIILISGKINAQAPVDYRDVAVIVNTNSKVSMAIGNYFMKQRNIPSANLIQFSGDTIEEITNSSFQYIRYQIKGSLSKLSGINYLVTTKGCPLKINRGGNFCDLAKSKYFQGYYRQIDSSYCASFESELMLILSTDSSRIGKADVIDTSTTDSLVRTHPYFEIMNDHFSSAKYNMFLVSRLDAFYYSEVINMINTSGPNLVQSKDSAQFVLDNVPYATIPDTMLNHSFLHTYKLLLSRGWNVNYDSSSKLINNQKNVLGYYSWGYNDPSYSALIKSKKFLNNSFISGSISSTLYSYSGNTLTYGATGYKATLGPLFSNGLCGGDAQVYEPLSFAMAEPTVLFGKYTDERPDKRFNLAESYGSACGTTSWMTTIIGDPKTSIIGYIPSIPNPVLDTISKVCKGKSRTIHAYNSMAGNYNWFATDSNTLKASGNYFDSTNSYWIKSGTTLNTSALGIGTYTYTFVNENLSGGAFRQISFSVGVCTDLNNDEPAEAILNIFPNPAHKAFNISCNGLNAQEAWILIKDAMGRIIYSQKLSINNGSAEREIILEGQAPGVYLISIQAAKKYLNDKIILY